MKDRAAYGVAAAVSAVAAIIAWQMGGRWRWAAALGAVWTVTNAAAALRSEAPRVTPSTIVLGAPYDPAHPPFDPANPLNIY